MKSDLLRASMALQAAEDAVSDWADGEFDDPEAKSALVKAFETRIQKSSKPVRNAVRVLDISFTDALPQVLLSIAIGNGRKEMVAILSPARAKKLAQALLVAVNEAKE